MIHYLPFSVIISCLANIDLRVRLQTLQLYFPTKLFYHSNDNQELTDNFSSRHKLIFANLNLKDFKVLWFIFTGKIAGVDLEVLVTLFFFLLPPSCLMIIKLMVSHAVILLALCIWEKHRSPFSITARITEFWFSCTVFSHPSKFSNTSSCVMSANANLTSCFAKQDLITTSARPWTAAPMH